MSMFEGKVVLVTGGASGIGAATASLYAASGARVMLADRNEALLRQVAESLGEPHDVGFHKTDVTDDDDVGRLVEATVERFGALHIAVNSAGVLGDTNDVANFDPEVWRAVLDVNLTGMFLCMRAEIPAILGSGGGSVVNIASGAGLVAVPGRCAYVASKHGVVGLTKAAALDYARQGVRVNAICPAAVDTPMHQLSTGGDPEVDKAWAEANPMGYIAKPEEIAECALWLSSPAASHVNGVALAVDGGYTAQ